ncbi:MAG TPA: hypothetical protein VFU76_04200 [Terriglobales bacterium]|nr:hypothetical protein [Terriglobales bacterium]
MAKLSFRIAILGMAVLLAVSAASAQLASLDSSTNGMLPDPSKTSIPKPGAQIPQPHDATQAPSLSLSPAVVMTKGSFGQSTTQTLTITNSTPRDMAFDMVAEDVVIRDGKRVFVPAGELPGSIAATAVFSAPSVLVKPFSAASVDVRLTLPAATDVRAVVALFRGTNKVPSSSGAVFMTASLGTLVTFTVSDRFQVSADPIIAENQSADANAVIGEWLTNTGAEPIIPEGMVAVLDDSGALVSKAPLIAQRLLPGERLQFKAECPATLPTGHYRVLASYQFEGQTVTKAGELVVQ